MDRFMPRLALHPGSRRPVGSTRPWTVRVALWSAGHRWPVLVAWFAVTIGLFVASQSLGGIKAVSATSPSELAQTESGRASLAMQSGGATSLPAAAWP
jgi:hypothetical protein